MKHLFSLAAFLLALLAAAPRASAQEHAPLPLPTGRPVIGLALQGGGALGMAHIGVLRWFEEHHIPVDRLAGTSMGSLIGGLYASGLSPTQIEALATGRTFESVFTLQIPYTDASYRRRQDRRELPMSLTIGLRHGFQLRNAIVGDSGVNAFLAAHMAAYNSAAVDFNHMPIPFRCVATDLTDLQPVVFDSGSLPSAVRASISIPGVFPPVQDARGHSLVDGGIVDNLPSDVVRSSLHADLVIAVHLDSEGSSAPKFNTSSIVSVLDRAFSAGIERNVREGIKAADLVLVVPVDRFTGMDYDKGEQLIEAGYQAAERNRAALLPYALDDRAWADHLAARRARLRPTPGLLRAVRVEGGPLMARQTQLAETAALKDKPIEPAATLTALKPIQASGNYTAIYQTYLATPGPTTAPDDALLIRLSRDPLGPPYLLISPEFLGSTNNPMRVALNLRLVDQDLGGYGSELRLSSRVGYLNELSAEYYRRLSRSGYFLQPLAHVGSEPVYIWQQQNRIAERSLTTLMAGLSAGRTFSNTLQLAADWRFDDRRWNLVTGSGGGPTLSGTAQTGLLRLDIDRAQASAISPNGWRLSASAGSLYHAAQSSNAPLFHLALSQALSASPNNIFAYSLQADSYLRANVAQPYRFTLGGPMRLSASSFDEYRGTDLYLARAGYMRRIAAMPTGLGHGLYLALGYEAGQIWSPEQRTFLRQDGVTGLLVNTPIGLVSIGTAVGDAGHRKVFFTLGRAF